VTANQDRSPAGCTVELFLLSDFSGNNVELLPIATLGDGRGGDSLLPSKEGTIINMTKMTPPATPQTSSRRRFVIHTDRISCQPKYIIMFFKKL
jgi:hypothetical protein